MSDMLCPCHSGMLYSICCKPYHEGKLAENALKLMRSRYCAYALHLADYIINTTHPQNPLYLSNAADWKQKILKAYADTRFEGLEILEFLDGKENAYVTFRAHLKAPLRDVSFTEKSHFEKIQDHWLYKEGKIIGT